jgi:mannose-6-phosphate isomerase
MTTTNQYNLDPFKLKPKFAERVWGKTSLAPWYAETGTTEKVGEAWLTGPDCVIVGGAHNGRTLADLSTQCVGTLGDGEFPILVKMLFPAEKLSVQVHPNDEEAKALGLKRGKTECWYVLEATEGASVACGLKHGIELDHVRNAIADGTLEDLLEMVPVSVGDMIFVDAGTVHAIGPGVVLLEVQQMCDVTYRLFDYGRPRELHLEAGLAVVKTRTNAGKRIAKNGDGYTRLIHEKNFVVDRFEIPAGMTFEMHMDGVGCIVGVEGEAAVNAIRFGIGEAVVVAVGSVAMSSAHGAVFLRVFEPAS